MEKGNNKSEKCYNALWYQRAQWNMSKKSLTPFRETQHLQFQITVFKLILAFFYLSKSKVEFFFQYAR